ncbi:SWIM zinc finger family protein [Mycolicibacterium sp. XJ870]
MPLSETALFSVAGDLIFARGEEYVRYVRGLRITEFKAYASIQAKNVYTVELDWSGPLPDGVCTCPHNADGNFCKHLVATGLAAIDSGRVSVDDAPGGTADAALQAVVRAMDVDELRELVMTLAQRDGEVRRMLEMRAATVSGDDAQARAEFEEYVLNTLAFRGFVDYRRSFEVAEAASDMLDELESHLDAGAAEIVRPALVLALTELRDIIGQVDDSDGWIAEQCERAADLYARACRLGEPDRVALAKWLVKFRADSPGWPNVGLADFVDAFDEKALATYRRAVAALDRKLKDRGELHRFEADRMLLELADHDGDVDQAIHLLSQGDHPKYGAIVDRLRAAGRHGEAVGWIDRAVANGRISSHGGGNDYWLNPDRVAATYKALGRIEDAIAVLRADFVRRPTVQNYRVLLDFAAGVDRADTERVWAYDRARELASDRFAAGAVLVQLYMSDGDIDAAWQAADQYGPGWAWRELADRGAEARPVDAADLYRPELEKDLRYPNSKLYPDIAARLATMAKLYERGGRSAEFASFIAQIRQEYGRRPSLMKALDAKGL